MDGNDLGGIAADVERLAAMSGGPAEARAGATRCGAVRIVGAGPGAADLLTIRAWRAIAWADVVLHDALVGPEVLAMIPPSTRCIAVGKRAGAGGARQAGIQASLQALMIAHARAGRNVVRLKGGDPAMFGRLGEEIVALVAAGVPFEIVPGITAASGCAAALGIPLTDRDGAHGVQFVAARRASEVSAAQWREHGLDGTTLAIYMGGGQLASICKALVSAGRAADTPLAIVRDGTRSGAQVWRGSLGTPGIEHLQATQPVLLLVGRVVAYMQPGAMAMPCLAECMAANELAPGMPQRPPATGGRLVTRPRRSGSRAVR